jgi:hypothetical protein
MKCPEGCEEFFGCGGCADNEFFGKNKCVLNCDLREPNDSKIWPCGEECYLGTNDKCIEGCYNQSKADKDEDGNDNGVCMEECSRGYRLKGRKCDFVFDCVHGDIGENNVCICDAGYVLKVDKTCGDDCGGRVNDGALSFLCGEECVLNSEKVCADECERGYIDVLNIGICELNCEKDEEGNCLKESEGSEENRTFPWWGFLLIGVGVVVVGSACVAFYFYYKRKKLREEQEAANIEELMDEHSKEKNKANGEKTKKWKKMKEEKGSAGAAPPPNTSLSSDGALADKETLIEDSLGTNSRHSKKSSKKKYSSKKPEKKHGRSKSKKRSGRSTSRSRSMSSKSRRSGKSTNTSLNNSMV